MFDEVAEEEGGAEPEDFEDQANQGKQPFDHDTPLVYWYPFSECMMMKYDGGELVVNHNMMHTLLMNLPCSWKQLVVDA